MSEEAAKPRKLGRGLSALLGDEPDDLSELDKVRSSKTVPVEFLHPGVFQPRRHFAETALEELAESIREKGVLQPILVRRDPNDPNGFEIIAGERRWRAAQMAQLHEVPVIVKEFSDRDALEVALVENLQRQDLSPIEEAEGYSRLLQEFGHNQEELARVVGKSRSHVANSMRLLGLPKPVRVLVEDGSLSAGHARALLNVTDPEGLAKQVIARGLNVRQTEKLAQASGIKTRGGRKDKGETSDQPIYEKDADTRALERDLSNLLGLKVNIEFHGKGGAITIHYSNVEQLDDILHRLSNYESPEPKDDEDLELERALGSLNADLALSETDLLIGGGEDASHGFTIEELLDPGDFGENKVVPPDEISPADIIEEEGREENKQA